jgi:hypothetical protein
LVLFSHQGVKEFWFISLGVVQEKWPMLSARMISILSSAIVTALSFRRLRISKYTDSWAAGTQTSKAINFVDLCQGLLICWGTMDIMIFGSWIVDCNF